MAYGAGDKPSSSPRPRRRRPAPTPQTQLGAIPTLGRTPTVRGRANPTRGVHQAQRHMPATPVPHIPIIRNPTPRQTRAAQKVVRDTLNRAAPPGPNRVARKTQALRNIAVDPRTRHFAKAADHYNRAAERQQSARVGRQVIPTPPPLSFRRGPLPPIDVPLSARTEQIAAGRTLTAAKIARDGSLRPGTPDKRIGVGPATIAPAAIQRALLGATTLNTGDLGPRTFVGHVGSDLKALGIGPFVGGYTAASAAFEGLRKHPELLIGGPLWGGITAALTTHKGQGLAKGVAQQYAHEAAHPISSFQQHPLLTTLDFAGAASIAGRTAGAGARALGSTVDAGGVRGSLARAGSTVRPPIALSNDPASVLKGARFSRTHSRDLTRKFFQVGQDQSREVLRHADGTPVTIMDRGRQVPVLKAYNHAEREHLQRTQADFETARTNAQTRHNRNVASRESRVSARAVGGRRNRDVTAMVTEGTITSARHLEADLRAHRDRLAANLAHDEQVTRTGKGTKIYRDKKAIASAKARIKTADKILNDPKSLAQAEKIVAEGERHGAKEVAADRRKVALGLGQADELTRARLKVVAVEHMGARHHTIEDHARLERAARQAEDAARVHARSLPKGSPERHAAMADLSRLREERIAVSGRDPALVHRHETAVAQAENARRTHQAAQASIARLKATRDRLIGAQSSRRGRRGADARRDLPSREEFIRDRPKPARGEPDPTVEALTRNVKPGGSGVSIASEHVAQRFADGSPAGWGRELPGSKVVVARDATGKPIGALRITLDSRGKADVLEVAVDPKYRGKGVASRLYAEADKAGYDVEAASGRHGLTEAGAGFKHKRMRGAAAREARATTAEQRKLAQVDKLLKAANAQERALHERRGIAEHRARETPMPPSHEGLRTAEGKHLPTSQIEDFLRSRGRDPGTVAYLPPEVSSRQFYSQNRPGSRGSLSTEGPRTGAAHRAGTTEASAELLRAAGVRSSVVITKAESIDSQIADHGLRHPAWSKAQRGEPLDRAERSIVKRGGLFNAKEADEAIRRLENDTGERYAAVRAYPSKLDSVTQGIIREDLQGPGGMESLGERLLNDRLVDTKTATSSRARNIVLMPAAQVERQLEHLRPAGTIERFFQVINRPFRYAVLPQFRWLSGNFVEPYIVRLTAEGSGLNVFGLAADIRAQSKILKGMERSGDPRVRAQAEAIKAQQTGSGLFVGGGEANSIHRRLADISPRAYGGLVSRLPVVGQMVDMIGQAGHMLAAPLRFFFHVNRVIETGAQRAGFGHSVRRDIQNFTGSWAQTLVLGQKAVNEVARGLVDTPTQRRFMREQEVLLGKYAGFSPKVRALIQGPAPFIPWTLNAARFIYWTMPTRHTALTSLLLKTNNVVAQDWKDLHANTPPGTLRNAVPNGKGGWIDVGRYTPYGVFGEEEGGGNFGGLVSQFAPQFTGIGLTAFGLDPFGRGLRVPKSASNPRGDAQTAQLPGIALNEFLGSIVPYLTTIQRLREGGGTPYATSNVISPKIKPGSKYMSAIERTFSPVRPTYLRGPTPSTPAAVKQSTAPLSRQDRILQRAAERQASGGLSDRQMQILERAALRGTR